MRIARFLASALALAAFLAAPSRAQDPSPEPVRIEAEEFGSHVLLRAPEGYSAEKEWPLLVALHGMGDKAEAFFETWGDLPARRGYFLAVPEGDQEAPCMCGRCAGTIRTWGRNSERFILWTIEEVRKRYKIDAGRITLAGFSAGAHMTFWIGMKNPAVFAAIVPCAGILLPGLSAEEIGLARTLPVLGFVGREDPFRGSMRQSFERLREAGFANATLKELPGLGHEVPVGEHEGILDRLDRYAAERREKTQGLVEALEKGKKAWEGKKTADAVRGLLEVVQSGVHGPFAVEALAILQKAEALGRERLGEAGKKAAAGDRKGEAAILLSIREDFPGLPCAREAEEREKADKGKE